MNKKLLTFVFCLTVIGTIQAIKNQQIHLSPELYDSYLNLIQDSQYQNQTKQYNSSQKSAPTSYTTQKSAPTSYTTQKSAATSYTTKKSAPTSYSTQQQAPTTYTTQKQSAANYTTQKTYQNKSSHTTQQTSVYASKSKGYDDKSAYKASTIVNSSNLTVIGIFEQIKALQKNQIIVQQQNQMISQKQCSEQIEKFQCSKKSIWVKEQAQKENQVNQLNYQLAEKQQKLIDLSNQLSSSQLQTKMTCNNVNKQVETLREQVDCISKIQNIIKQTVAEINYKANQKPNYNEQLQKINNYFIEINQNSVHPLTKAFIEMSEVLLNPTYSKQQQVKDIAYQKVQQIKEDTQEQEEEFELYNEKKVKNSLKQVQAILNKLLIVLEKKIRELNQVCSDAQYKTNQIAAQNNKIIAQLKTQIASIQNEINDLRQRILLIKGKLKACEDIGSLIAQCEQEKVINDKILKQLKDCLILIQEIIKQLKKQPKLYGY